MKARIAAFLLTILAPTAAFGWVELGSYYQFGVIQIQLGDICDSVRFNLTPGDCSGDASNPDWRVEVEEAVARWHGLTSNFQFITDPEVGASSPGVCSIGDPNSAFFLDTICDFDAFGGSTLAVALTSYFFDGVSLHSDVIFNTAWSWGAYDDALGNHGGVIDFTRVAVHEFGHVAGLDHPAHESAIMAPIIHETLNSPQPDDVAGINAIYGVAKTIVIPDLNANGAQELATIRRTSLGATLVEVRDSVTDVLIRSLTFFDSGFEPIDLAFISDEDGSGSPEIGVVGTRYSDQRSVIEIRNITGAEGTRRIWLLADLTPMQLENIGDADGNGVDELAVLAVRETDLQALIDIRNCFGAIAGRTIYLPQLQSPAQMKVFADAANPAIPRLAVLMSRWTDLRSVVEMRNAIGAPGASRIFTSSVATPQSMEVFSSVAGYRLAILSVRNSDFRSHVELSNVDGTARSTQWLAAGNTPLEIRAINDADADGQQDLAILSRRDADGRNIVEIRNPDGTNKRTLYLVAGFESNGTLVYLNDANGDSFEEIAVLLSRQTDARRRVDWRNAAGPNTAATNTVWLSP